MQCSPQRHHSYVSSSSTEIFQHCQVFVKHGQNLCHLLFILASQRCAGAGGTATHFHSSRGKLAVTCTFQDKEYPLIETEPGPALSSFCCPCRSQFCPIWMCIHNISLEFKSLTANKIIQLFIKS